MYLFQGDLTHDPIYKEKFKIIPPIDIWNSSEIRFKEINFQRVNLDKYWVLEKPKPFLK